MPAARLDLRDYGQTGNDAGGRLAFHRYLPVDYADGLIRIGTQSAIVQPEAGTLLRKLMTERGMPTPPPGPDHRKRLPGWRAVRRPRTRSAGNRDWRPHVERRGVPEEEYPAPAELVRSRLDTRLRRSMRRHLIAVGRDNRRHRRGRRARHGSGQRRRPRHRPRPPSTRSGRRRSWRGAIPISRASGRATTCAACRRRARRSSAPAAISPTRSSPRAPVSGRTHARWTTRGPAPSATRKARATSATPRW